MLAVVITMLITTILKSIQARSRGRSESGGKGRLPGEGNGNPLQYSCLENSMDRRA